MKKYIIIIFMFLLIGCVKEDPNYDIISVKRFLFENDIQISIDKDYPVYDKYSDKSDLAFVSVYGKILTIFKGDKKEGEKISLLVTDEWQPVKLKLKEKYYVSGVDGCFCGNSSRLQIGIPKKKLLNTKTKKPINKKEVKTMGLSLGTWILLIIVMIVVAKVAHKMSLKTIFKPTKKVSKHIEKEWKDS